MQAYDHFSIHRIVTQNDLPTPENGRIAFASSCIKKACDDILTPVTVIQTAGGFLIDLQDLSAFPTGMRSRIDHFRNVVESTKILIRNFLSVDLIDTISKKANYLTLGVDIFDLKKSKKHVELVLTFDVYKHDFIGCTGKSHPNSNQVATLLYCLDLKTHFQYLGNYPVLVLGCHDLNMFSPRSRKSSSETTYKGGVFAEMQKLSDNFKPIAVLHHPHTTDSQNIWSTAWSGVKKYIPSVKTYSSGIHYKNFKGEIQRKPLDKILKSTAMGDVKNTVIGNISGE